MLCKNPPESFQSKSHKLGIWSHSDGNLLVKKLL